MVKKINIGKNAKVLIRLNTTQSVVTEEEEKSMISLFAKKYNIPEKNIRIEKNYVSANGEDVVLAGDMVQNMYDPKFQQGIMQQWLKNNNIEDIDFEEIVKIDSQINSLIDYDSYEKSKRYIIKWVKWSNFLSYGPDNYFDFTTLHGLVLLNGEPANKSGKSTFAYDLLHFLLFGKTNTNKAKTLGDLFNNYLPDERTINVEGCINIDGDDYIIRRTLTRPAAGKKSKTVTNKVEYFKVSPDGSEELLSETNEQGATTTATSKIIKEALGNENDFDLIISANAKDLDSLITDMTETEKGRLLSRWIGLSVIEDKDVKAREKWNKEISVGRYCDMYNKSQIETDVENFKENIKNLEEENEKKKKAIEESEEKIKGYNQTRDTLLSSKQTIDENLLKVNVTTLEATLNRIKEDGVRKKGEVEILNKELKEMGEISYSEEEYKALKSEGNELLQKMTELSSDIKHLTAANEALAKAEVCPTCHRKLDNVDNSVQIKKNEEDIAEKMKIGKEKKTKYAEVTAKMEAIEGKRTAATRKSQLELKIAAIESNLAQQRLEYSEKNNLLKEINKNKEAITKNGEIDASINLVNANISAEENIKRAANFTISQNEKEIAKDNEAISLRKGYLVKIDEERKVEKTWKTYLQMIGKDGICKMVLKNTLPIINNELNHLLCDVTDFKVEVTMNDKNDIDFILIRDGVYTRLSAASGLEKTQAALALRVVLGKMSKLSRPPILILDEILSGVARENYDDMKKLFDKVVGYYEAVLHITHLSEISDWHNGGIISVVKENNISRINPIKGI